MSARACRIFLFLLANLALGTWTGCGGGGGDASRPQVTPAGGTVLYKGQPVEGAMVVFVPQGHDQGAAGRTDASGKFALQTFDPNDGAVPGEYKVTVTKSEMAAAPAAATSDDYEAPTPSQERALLPNRYSKPDSSQLTATVTEAGPNDFTFELKD